MVHCSTVIQCLWLCYAVSCHGISHYIIVLAGLTLTSSLFHCSYLDIDLGHLPVS